MQPQTRHSPVIVGDHYELAETAALQNPVDNQDDLMVKAAFSAGLLPMSTYAKPHDFNVNGKLPHSNSTAPSSSRLPLYPSRDLHKHASVRYGLTSAFAEPDVRRPSQAYSSFTEYNARRPLQDLMYLQSALPGAANAQVEQPPTVCDRQIDHLNYEASALYQPRATLEATPSNYHDFELRKVFQVSGYSPQRGNEGARVCVHLESTSDLISPTAQTANLMFASCPIPVTWTRLDAAEQHACYKYSVHATAPAFSETGSSTPKIPLHLQLEGQSRLDVSSIYIGDWLYEGGKHLEHRSSIQEASRKRKVTDEPSGTLRSTKRTTPSEHQITQSQDYASYAHPSASLAYPQSLDFSTMQRRYTVYGRSELQQSLRNEADSVGLQGLIGGASTARSAVRHSTGQTSLWNSPFGAGYESPGNLQPNTPSSFQVSSTSPQRPGNWNFIRQNRIQQPSRGTTSAGSSPDDSLSKYPMYQNRAVLETKRVALDIRGNLNAMGNNWTPEERSAERRLVRFWREFHGSTINVFFIPLRADEPGLPQEMDELRISCIYWKEQSDYFVTSVDTIKLLELVFDAAHKMEEKNRIRRNIQTYKPDTISKAKGNERFFELIMGFPIPKPSSIKKSVKVFKWSILEEALNKVVNKFVCAYLSGDPSDGPIAPQPHPNLSGALSAAGTRTHGSSAAYAQTINSMIPSPPSLPHGLPSRSQPSPLQQASGASLAHSYTVQALGSQYTPTHTSNSPYTPQSSVPSLSPAWSTVSNMGRGRSSQGSPEDLLTPTSDYYTRRPNTNAYFGSPYALQGSSEATATLGLPGRASEDLSAFLGQDVALSINIGGAQYGRQLEMGDGMDAMQFKEE